MSTYWYFECLDHTPTLRSDDEFTQHTDDNAFKNAQRLASERPVLPMYEMPDSYQETLGSSLVYFERNARQFLVQHPDCRLGLVNEYDERRALDKPTEIMPAHIPTEDAFGITHGVTVEQAVGFMAAQFQTIAEAGPTIQRLEGVIEQKAIEEKHQCEYCELLKARWVTGQKEIEEK